MTWCSVHRAVGQTQVMWLNKGWRWQAPCCGPDPDSAWSRLLHWRWILLLLPPSLDVLPLVTHCLFDFQAMFPSLIFAVYDDHTEVVSHSFPVMTYFLFGFGCLLCTMTRLKLPVLFLSCNDCLVSRLTSPVWCLLHTMAILKLSMPLLMLSVTST